MLPLHMFEDSYRLLGHPRSSTSTASSSDDHAAWCGGLCLDTYPLFFNVMQQQAWGPFAAATHKTCGMMLPPLSSSSSAAEGGACRASASAAAGGHNVVETWDQVWDQWSSAPCISTDDEEEDDTSMMRMTMVATTKFVHAAHHDEEAHDNVVQGNRCVHHAYSLEDPVTLQGMHANQSLGLSVCQGADADDEYKEEHKHKMADGDAYPSDEEWQQTSCENDNDMVDDENVMEHEEDDYQCADQDDEEDSSDELFVPSKTKALATNTFGTRGQTRKRASTKHAHGVVPSTFSNSPRSMGDKDQAHVVPSMNEYGRGAGAAKPMRTEGVALPPAARKRRGRKSRTRFPEYVKMCLDDALKDRFANPSEWTCRSNRHLTKVLPKMIALCEKTGLTPKQIRNYMHNNARKGKRLAMLSDERGKRKK